jgi:hypothetical protein
MLKWEDLTELQQSRQLWSDSYKDAYNYRPRDIDTSEWTQEKFNQELSRLSAIIVASIIAEREQERLEQLP